jgi:hypothetical protein
MGRSKAATMQPTAKAEKKSATKNRKRQQTQRSDGNRRDPHVKGETRIQHSAKAASY